MARQLIQQEYHNEPIVPKEELIDSSIGLGGRPQDAGKELLQRATIFGAASKTEEHAIDIPAKIEASVTNVEDGMTDDEIFAESEMRVERLKKEAIKPDAYDKLIEQGIPDHLVYRAFKDKPETQYDLLYSIEKYKDYDRADKNIADNADAVDYLSIVIATFGDVDTLATGGVGTILKTARTGTKLATVYSKGVAAQKKSPVISSAIAGTTYAGLNQALINHYGGDSNSDAIKHSALFGAGIGTTLGWMMKTSNKFSESARNVVTADGTKQNHGEYITQEINKLDENIKVLEGKQALEKQLKTQNDAKIVQKLDEAKDLVTTTKKDFKQFLTHVKASSIKQITKRLDKVKDEFKFHEQAVKNVDELKKTAKVLKDELEFIRSKVANAQKKSGGHGTTTKKQLAKRKALATKDFADVRKQIAKYSKKIKSEQELKQLHKDMKHLDETIARATELQSNVSKAESILKKAPTVKGKSHEELRKVEHDDTIEGKLAAINKQLEGTNHKELRTSLEENKKALERGETPKGVHKEMLTRKQKLQEDLDEYLSNPLTPERLAENPMYNHMVTMVEKWVPRISPVSRLFVSDNQATRSIISLLSPPIVAMDTFVNNLTAKTFIRDMKLKVNAVMQDINSDYEAYIKANKKPMTVIEYFHMVEVERLNQIGKQHRELVKSMPNIAKEGEELSDVFKAARNEMNIEYKHLDKNIEASMRKLENYYSSMGATGKELKITNLMDVSKAGYGAQLYSEKIARTMGKEAFVDHLVKAQHRFAIDNHLPIEPERFKASAETAHYMALSENQRYEKNFREFAPKTQTSTTGDKQRSIRIYADDMAKVQDENTILNMMTYSRAMGGKFGLKKFLGIENKADITPRLKAAGVSNEKELKDLNAVIDTIAGFREAPRYSEDWEKMLHGASTVSSILHTMGFGIASLTEVSTVVANTGFINTMGSLIPAWKGTMKAYSKNKLSDNDIMEASILREVGNHKFGMEVNRFEVEGDLGLQHKAQAFGDTIVHKMANASGLTFLTDWGKVASDMAGTKWILDMARSKTLSKANRRRLNQNGISDSDLQNIAESLHTDGKLTGFDRARLSPELLDRFDRAKLNIAYNSILHPDGMNMPRIMTEGSDKLSRTLNNSLFKFMRFPIASYEALLLNGIATADAQQAIAVALQFAMWSQILLAKDAMNNWGENKDNKRYNPNTEEGRLKLLQDTMMALSPISGPMAIGNFASQATRGESLNGYASPLSGGITLKDAQGIPRGDIPLNLYGFKMTKMLENLDKVNKVSKPKVILENEYEFNIGD